jgi:hypothetical protein
MYLAIYIVNKSSEQMGFIHIRMKNELPVDEYL